MFLFIQFIATVRLFDNQSKNEKQTDLVGWEGTRDVYRAATVSWCWMMDPEPDRGRLATLAATVNGRRGGWGCPSRGPPPPYSSSRGPPPLAGPSVVMNGTKLVGGSLSTNLPHTPFPPVTSAASNENAKIPKSESVTWSLFLSPASDASLALFRRMCRKYPRLSTAANSHRGLTNIWKTLFDKFPSPQESLNVASSWPAWHYLTIPPLCHRHLLSESMDENEFQECE